MLISSATLGSPPRAWGQRCAPSSTRRPALRFTPTCVGTTHREIFPDELRGRFTPTCVGTTPSIRNSLATWCGSPPRAWGQRSIRRCVRPKQAVHPHVRGDNSEARSRAPASGAVHPHVRGDNAMSRFIGAEILRFTPTCVGTTPAQCSRTDPRAGSPPRAWGQRMHHK